MPNFRMQQAGLSLPTLPGLSLVGAKTYAAWPVWKDSTTREVRFKALPKKAAVRLFHRARDFDRQTRRPGRHGGAVGHAALQVLHALLFDFLNYTSGRLDPSYAAIARKANVCQRTVANAVKKLRALGMLNWVRRCAESRREDGRFMLEQETNAYAVLPESQWLGYRPPLDPPVPDAGTWGACPPLASVLVQATPPEGASIQQQIEILASDPTDELAARLASLGRMVEQAERRKAQ